jgi:hypothetical protein
MLKDSRLSLEPSWCIKATQLPIAIPTPNGVSLISSATSRPRACWRTWPLFSAPRSQYQERWYISLSVTWRLRPRNWSGRTVALSPRHESKRVGLPWRPRPPSILVPEATGVTGTGTSFVLETVCGQCPGPSSDPRAADGRLLKSLLGKRQLSKIERMGRISFISM